MSQWTAEFQERMRRFEHDRADGGVGLSVKVRVSSGCFHREHSPRGYAILDKKLSDSQRRRDGVEFVEHESGPEVLIYVAAGTAIVSLIKSIIDLVVTVLKARADGIKQGDHPKEPLEVIVRRSLTVDRVDDEVILRVGHSDAVDRAVLEMRIDEAVRKLIKSKTPPPAG